MNRKEQIKALQNLAINLNAYIPHRCYNCIYSNSDPTYCSLHDKPIVGREDGCGRFEMEIYETARMLGVEL
jgi:hypothetical protein